MPHGVRKIVLASISIFSLGVALFFLDIAPIAAAPPSNLSATAVCDENTSPYPGALITLTWADNSDDESWFEIFRSSGGPTPMWERIAQVGPNITTYPVEHRDLSYIQFRTENFRVRARIPSGYSDFTNEANVNLPSCGKMYTYVNTVVADKDGNVYRNIGGGNGSIETSPTGIDCNSSIPTQSLPYCHFYRDTADTVTIAATPSPGSQFVGWTGDVSGSSNPLVVSPYTFHLQNINANFELVRNLTIIKSGTGSGTITSNPAGINCGGTCSYSYVSGTSVTLTATPAEGSSFIGWSGDPDCGDGIVNMNADKTCSAMFNINSYSLLVSKTGTGTGTVTSDVGGINCGSDCFKSYTFGTSVILTATPALDSSFSGWSGDSDCLDGMVSISANTSCTAAFTFMSGAEADIRANDANSLTIPYNSSALIEWCGSDAHTCANAVSCKIGTALGRSDISSSVSGSYTTPALTANTTYYLECTNSLGNTTYDSVPIALSYTLSITKSGTGSGTITSNPAGINCGGTCSYSYVSGTSVTLTATPAPGSYLASVGGDPDCLDGIVTMNANKTCTARFDVNPAAEADIRANDANSLTIPYNSSALIEWCGSDAHTCANAVSCKIGTALGRSDISSSVSGSYTTPALTANTTYYLECTNSLGNTTYDSVPIALSYTLSITKSGTGSGTITSNPAGINCGINCSTSFSSGTSVTLTATPASNSYLASVGGDPDCLDGIVTMNANKTCTARFDLISPAEADIRANDANSLTIPYNSSALIEWCGSDAHTCANAVSCKIGTALGRSDIASSISGSYATPALAINTRYYLECVNNIGNTSYDSVLVRINYTLSTTKSGTGSGTITSAPAGINCGGSCSASYLSGTSVTLTATPSVGSSFAGWSGDADCSDGRVAMNANKTCTATFDNVTAAEADIRANDANSVALPPGSSALIEWCGADAHACINAISCKVGTSLGRDNIASSVSGSYTTPALNVSRRYYLECDNAIGNTSYDSVLVGIIYNLDVSKNGLGSGRVTSAPAGINCGGSCSASYLSGTSVTLTATPSVGSSFAGWSGDADCSDGRVAMNANKGCIATFESSYALTVARSGTGSGVVEGDPPGFMGDDINCGSNCSAPFNPGTSVTLTPAPSLGSSFMGWSGNADCSDGMITMDDNKTCTARFDITPAAEADIRANDANSLTVPYNSSVLIEWCGADAHTCANAVSCKAGTTFGGNDIASSVSGSYTTPPLTSDTTYYLECDNNSGNTTYDAVSIGVMYTLVVDKSGAGSGAITSSPGSINCGAICSDSFDSGTSVVLTAAPSAESSFYGWSGDADCSDGTVTMNANKTCTARFDSLLAEADIRANDANSLTVPYNSSVLIEWCGADAHTCANAVSCKAGTTFGGNDIASSVSGSYTTPPLTSDTTYYLECDNNMGSTSRSNVTVTVDPPILSINLRANPNSCCGCSSLNSELIATRESEPSSTAQGDIRYEFDCDNDGNPEHIIPNSLNTLERYSGCPAYTGSSVASVKMTQPAPPASGGISDSASALIAFAAPSCVPPENDVCQGNTYADSCGNASSCVGAKVCKSGNWREVAP